MLFRILKISACSVGMTRPNLIPLAAVTPTTTVRDLMTGYFLWGKSPLIPRSLGAHTRHYYNSESLPVQHCKDIPREALINQQSSDKKTALSDSAMAAGLACMSCPIMTPHSTQADDLLQMT